MGEQRNVYQILFRNLKGNPSRTLMWEDNIKMRLGERWSKDMTWNKLFLSLSNIRIRLQMFLNVGNYAD